MRIVAYGALWLALSSYGVAQDRITYKNGNSLSAQVQSVDDSTVLMKTTFGEIRASRREIDLIRFDGSFVEIKMGSGELLRGMIVEETETAVTVMSAAAKKTIERSEIAALTRVSVMKFDATGRLVTEADVVAATSLAPVISYVAADKTGKPIAELSHRDLRVKLDDVPITPTGSEGVALKRLLIVLDASSSMDTQRKELSDALDSLVRRLVPATVEIMVFNTDVRLLEGGKMPAEQLAGVEFKGGSLLYDAVTAAVVHTSSASCCDAAVLVTDGDDTGSDTVSSLALERLRSSYVPFYVVGIGAPREATASRRDFNTIDASELGRFASVTGGELTMKNPSKPEKNPSFLQIFETIAAQITSRRLLQLDTSLLKPGWHKLEIESSKDGVKVRYKKDLFVPAGS